MNADRAMICRTRRRSMPPKPRRTRECEPPGRRWLRVAAAVAARVALPDRRWPVPDPTRPFRLRWSRCLRRTPRPGGPRLASGGDKPVSRQPLSDGVRRSEQGQLDQDCPEVLRLAQPQVHQSDRQCQRAEGCQHGGGGAETRDPRAAAGHV